VFAQWLNSEEVEEDFEKMLSSYRSVYGKIPEDLETQFEFVYGAIIRSRYLDPLKIGRFQNPNCIGKFRLGIDSSSSISVELLSSQSPLMYNTLHLYFEAQLAHGKFVS